MKYQFKYWLEQKSVLSVTPCTYSGKYIKIII